MKLTIPYFQQERAVTCEITALRMVLGYCKDESTEKELLRGVKLHSFGTFSTDLGLVVLNRGFRVTCYTSHLELLGPLNLDYGAEIDAEIETMKPIVLNGDLGKIGS